MEVRMENLTKEFSDKTGKITVAVNDFTVSIEAGKLIGLLGPSGCGKSTTLYLVAGLLKPTAGRIYFGEDDITSRPPEKRGIGLVFQNYALYPHMTVRQNIVFPLENMGVAKDERNALAQEMAELVHIGDLMERKPNQLSGGQQQRVAIARALVKKPKVLLLDEPLSNLDARLRLQTREEIKRIQRETGITTIFVTHDQEEAMSISDEIVVMNYGLLQQKDHPQEVYDNPVNMFVAKFLGNPPINTIKGFIKNNSLYIEDVNSASLELKDKTGILIEEIKESDQEVYIGIRPEFFKVTKDGKIKAFVEIVEHIGRDVMAIAKIQDTDVEIRALVPSDTKIKANETIKFSYSKYFVFNASTGERIK
ncbi:MAG: ABC transporter ATP-binding protein [Bacilli bacterium]|nr:ABC transporter ATP-binding protein [Bacilli bacterium]